MLSSRREQFWEKQLLESDEFVSQAVQLMVPDDNGADDENWLNGRYW